MVVVGLLSFLLAASEPAQATGGTRTDSGRRFTAKVATSDSCNGGWSDRSRLDNCRIAGLSRTSGFSRHARRNGRNFPGSGGCPSRKLRDTTRFTICLSLVVSSFCFDASSKISSKQSGDEPFIISILRGNGILIPFAKYQNGLWHTPAQAGRIRR